VWLDLGPAPLVRLAGPDARRFCNGMFTNNVRDLPVGAHNRSAMIDDRGRICGFLDLCCLAEDQFVAVIEGIDVPSFLERYERYVVFDEVELAALHGWWHLSVQGAHAAEVPTAQGALDALRHSSAEDEPFGYARSRAPGGGVDVIVPDAARAGVVAALDGAAVAASADDAEVLRILAGQPAFPRDTGDKRLVAELGLRDQLLSFDKGCYIGQETVNRVDVMGQVRRSLAGVRIRSADLPPWLAPGAEVWGEEHLGDLTSLGVLPDGNAVGLAVLKKPGDSPGTEVRLLAGDHSCAGVVEPLPFPDRW
jgi:tRNA-modifying protein YgfZ